MRYLLISNRMPVGKSLLGSIDLFECIDSRPKDRAIVVCRVPLFLEARKRFSYRPNFVDD